LGIPNGVHQRTRRKEYVGNDIEDKEKDDNGCNPSNGTFNTYQRMG
jgi:hypothetical protein